MTKRTGNRRGRPRKLPEFVVRLGTDQKEWNRWLSRTGFPEHSSSKKEVLGLHRLGNLEDSGESLTLQRDFWLPPVVEDEKDIVLPARWQRYLQYMDVVAEYLFPKDKGTNLKRLALQDARSRSKDPAPKFPAELGTPEELRDRLAHHEVEIRLGFNRRLYVIRFVVFPMPPDVDENLDPREEPKGHWEGLRWFRDPEE